VFGAGDRYADEQNDQAKAEHWHVGITIACQVYFDDADSTDNR
jgi:hypothetical protein